MKYKKERNLLLKLERYTEKEKIPNEALEEIEAECERLGRRKRKRTEERQEREKETEEQEREETEEQEREEETEEKGKEKMPEEEGEEEQIIMMED